MNVSVIGAGSWGTAVANLLAEKGYHVKLWARDGQLAKDINRLHHNPRYLKDIQLENEVEAVNHLTEALKFTDVIIFAVPSHAMREIVKSVKEALKSDPLIVSLTKGLETDTMMRMSEVISQVMPAQSGKVGVLSGPNHAEEVSLHVPSATVISSRRPRTATRLQEMFMTPYFRVYTNTDIIGVELGAAIKNVIAIAAGISDGLGYGDNTKASLMTRGLTEMTRLGVAAGAKDSTFAGLSGVGDLIATCTSQHSRNRAVGERLAKGASPAEITRETRMIAEGINTCAGINELAKKYKVEMPISRAVYEVIYKSKNPYECVQELMGRGATDELDMLS